MLKRRRFTQLSLFTLGLGLSNCSQVSLQPNPNIIKPFSEKADLVIWWEQGFLPEENEQIEQLVQQWERKTGHRVELKLLPVDLIAQQLTYFLANSETYQIPNIIYSVGVDTSLAPQMAWEDKLMDLSEIINPVKDKYSPIALSQVFYRNQAKQARSYYALPLWQSDSYFHCWGSLLQEIDRTPQDIPQEWDTFWQFWKTAQKQLRLKNYPNLYSIGLCMSSLGFDTYTSLKLFMDAHNVLLVDKDGQLLLEVPENRKRFIEALSEFTSLYFQGYVPPTAAQWSGAGNNNSFLNGEILMTQNLTLSIPLTQKLTTNQYDRDAAERYPKMVTIDRPLKVNNTQLLTHKGTKQAIVPKASKNPELTQEFLKYLIQPENLMLLLKGFKGRVFPVMPELLKDPFWNDANDPHLSAALRVYAQPSYQPYEVIHAAFSEIQKQQLWAKTVLKVIQDKASVPESADWLIAQIKPIWQGWEKQL